jgi:hypothetical protein
MGDTPPPNLDKVYAEAGQWLRLCNAIIWAVGAIFVPVSEGCIGLALVNPGRKPLVAFFAAPSIFSFCAWLYLSWLYRRTSATAREALMNIERAWNIPKSMAVYSMQGQVGHGRYSQIRVQRIAFMLLVVLWVLLLALLRK